MRGLLARLFRRGRAEPAVEQGPDPRAEELRRRLEEARPLVEEGEQEAFEGGEQPVDEAEVAPSPADPDARRREVHERARAALDEMRREPPPEP